MQTVIFHSFEELADAVHSYRLQDFVPVYRAPGEVVLRRDKQFSVFLAAALPVYLLLYPFMRDKMVRLIVHLPSSPDPLLIEGSPVGSSIESEALV